MFGYLLANIDILTKEEKINIEVFTVVFATGSGINMVLLELLL